VYDTLTGELLQELRRGTDKADIVSIAFNANASMLASTSDKGTVHIFKLNERVHDNSASAASGSSGAAGSSASSSAAAGGSSAGASASPAGYASSRSLGGGGVAAPGGGGSTPGGGDGDGVVLSGSGERPHNPSFGFMKGILPKYFSSEWSFSQFRVPDARSIVAFGNEPNTIISE
jgi:WD repeat-containing protein 45